jgi:hypothetical protein
VDIVIPGTFYLSSLSSIELPKDGLKMAFGSSCHHVWVPVSKKEGGNAKGSPFELNQLLLYEVFSDVLFNNLCLYTIGQNLVLCRPYVQAEKCRFHLGPLILLQNWGFASKNEEETGFEEDSHYSAIPLLLLVYVLGHHGPPAAILLTIKFPARDLEPRDAYSAS